MYFDCKIVFPKFQMITECPETFSDFLDKGKPGKNKQKDLTLHGTVVKIEKIILWYFICWMKTKIFKKIIGLP